MTPNDDADFGENDLDVLRTVIGMNPEMALCAVALKMRQANGTPYPLESPDDLFSLFEGKEVQLGHHRINATTIKRYVPKGFFPIEDDDAFVRAVYLGLGKCNGEVSWALQAPPYAEELLAEVRQQTSNILDQKGS